MCVLCVIELVSLHSKCFRLVKKLDNDAYDNVCDLPVIEWRTWSWLQLLYFQLIILPVA